MTILAQDTFQRSNQSPWGLASDGVNTWSTATGPDTPSIVSNEGQLTGGTGRTVMYAGTGTTTDIDMFVRWSLSATGDTATIIARGNTIGNTCYVLRYKNGNIDIFKDVGGTSTTLSGPTAFTITGGSYYWFHLRIIGSNIWGNVWADGTAEPQTWFITESGDLSITGAGRFGVSATLSVSTNTANFDSFSAQDYINSDSIPVSDSFTPSIVFNPVDALVGDDSATTFTQVATPTESNTVTDSAAYVDTSSSVQAIGWGADTFTRANVGAGSWGTATDTQNWAVIGTGTATLSVNNNEGQAKNGSITFIALGSRTPTDVELLMRYQLGATADVAGLVSRLNTTANYYRADIGSGSLRIRKNVSNSFTSLQSVATTFSVTTGIFIWMRFRTTTQGSLALLQAKAWQDGTAEPLNWQISLTDGSLTSGGNFGIFVNPSGATNMLFDSFSAVQYISNDSLPTTDSAAYVESFVPVEAYPVDDSLSSLTDAWSATDSLSVSDSASYAYGFVPQEAYPAVDGLTLVDVYLPTESYVVDDSLSAFYDIYGPTDSLSASDAGSNIQQFTNNVMASVDSLVVSDSATFVQVAVPIEALTAVDSAAYSITTNPTEALTASDAASTLTVSYSVTESLTVSDTASSMSAVFVPTEDNTASDAFVGSAVFVPSDSLSASDAASSFTSAFAPSEALQASDVLSVSAVYSSTEALVVSDAASSFADVYVPQEVLSVVESLLSTDGASWTDGLSADDSGSSLVQITFHLMSSVDSLTASDSFTAQITFNGIESNMATDSLTGYVVFTPTEALQGLDSFTGVTTANLTESGTVSDVAAFAGVFSPSDNLSAADSAAFAGVLSAVEALLASDVLTGTDTPLWVDALTVSDSAAYVTVLVPVEALAALDALVATGAVSWVDTGAVSDAFAGTDVYRPVEALTVSDVATMVQVIQPPAVQVVSVVFRFRDGRVTFRVR